MTTVAVIGPGAIGGTVAAWLAQSADNAVTVCARTPFETLRIEAPDGPITASPTVLTDPSRASPVDWVLVCVKAYDTAGAALWLKGLTGPRTRVAILQNGVEHVARFSAHVPADRIVPCVVDIPAERVAAGMIRQRGTGTIVVPEGEGGAAFHALFAQTIIEVSPTADITTALWRKLCINCPGVVSAMAMKPAGVVHEPGVPEVMRALIAECIAVGRAEGAVLEDQIVDQVVGHIAGTPRDSINSIYGDRLAGRPTEIDARNGVICRLGRRHGIPTPMNDFAFAVISVAERP